MSGLPHIIKVLLADDHPVVRQGLQFCLSRQKRLRVVGEAADGDEAVKKALSLGPDLVLMDLAMPGLDGLAATEILRRKAPRIKVLALSVDNDRDFVARSMRAGAHGYVSKKASSEELLQAIECVHNGEPFFCPQNLAQSKKELYSGMSENERKVLVLITEGRRNKEIASDLRTQVRKIETYRERIMRRLNIRSVAGLTKFAIVNGLVSLRRDSEAALSVDESQTT